jgi:hypothetical protein
MSTDRPPQIRADNDVGIPLDIDAPTLVGIRELLRNLRPDRVHSRPGLLQRDAPFQQRV